MNIHEEKRRKVWSKEQLREAESNGIGSNIGGIMGLTPISMLLIIKNLCKNVDKPKISSFYSVFSARNVNLIFL
jgi:hypothetical protein